MSGEEHSQELFGVEISCRSESSTGLSIDITFIINGVKQPGKDFLITATTNYEVFVYPSLADYGFILRYPKGKEDITGHSFEP